MHTNNTNSNYNIRRLPDGAVPQTHNVLNKWISFCTGRCKDEPSAKRILTDLEAGGLIQLWHHRRRKSHSLQTRMRWVNAFQHDQLQFSADHKLQPPGMTLHQTNAPSSDDQQVLMLNHPVATRGSAADLYHLVTPRIDDTFSGQQPPQYIEIVVPEVPPIVHCGCPSTRNWLEVQRSYE